MFIIVVEGLSGLGKIYLFNALIIPVNFDLTGKVKVSLQRINVETARTILSQGFVSVVGHESTAQLLSKLMGIDVKPNRTTIFLEPGDVAVHFVLKKRLPEGVVLGELNLSKLEYWLVLSKLEQPLQCE